MPATRARLTIDLNAVAANHTVLRGLAGAAEVAPVIKADGYGLGAAPIARRLLGEGARSLFVARLEEGEDLRAALGPERPSTIYVFDGATAGSAPRLAAAGLVPILNSSAQVEVYAAFSRGHGGALPCALQIDTGMNRLGLRIEELQALAASPDRMTGLRVGMIMSHLACADRRDHPMNAMQAARFRGARALFAGVPSSLANTAGLFLGPDYAHQIVRPGIGLLGGGPFGKPHPDLLPVATLEAPILDVRAVAAGETVGYGADFRAQHPHRVAIVAAGYADGLARSAGRSGQVWFAGALRPLLGRISMDLIAVDVTGCDAARPGAMVELLGSHVLLDDAAEAAGTIAHEILTRLGQRAERIYLGEAV
jgi:alanine racemase